MVTGIVGIASSRVDQERNESEEKEPAQRGERLAPLLDDPVRAVRMEAARLLAGAPRERLTEAQRGALDRAYAEYVAAERFNADRPESHLYRATGRDPDGERVLRDLLARDPRTAPAHHALGLLLVRQRRQADARHELETAEQLVKRLEAEASR
jgi:Flp pilus assembly protein TadD